jgi:hypothetical protein
MSLVESIAGIGCVSRDTVWQAGEDIIFLSNKGVRSLGRTIQEKSMPLSDLTVNISDELASIVASADKDNIKGIYSRQLGYYLLSFPDSGKVYCLDTRKINPDNSLKVTTWDLALPCLCDTLSGDVYFGVAGYAAKYQGNKDAVLSDGTGGSTFTATYKSGWTDLHEDVSDRVKILKSMNLRLYGGAAQTVRFTWEVDYEGGFGGISRTLVDNDAPAEFNIAEFGVGEFSGGINHYKVKIPLKYTGRVMKVGIVVPVSDERVALQQLNIKAKVGRMD